jgi:hypothetical protein
MHRSAGAACAARPAREPRERWPEETDRAFATASGGLEYADVVDDGEEAIDHTVTEWVLLSESRDVLDDDDVWEATVPPPEGPVQWPLWTDDYSNLWQVVRFR